MNRKNKIPQLKKRARNLMYICLSIILPYILCPVIAGMNISPFLAEQFIQSALAATAISFCGGLLFDLEIRHAEDKS